MLVINCNDQPKDSFQIVKVDDQVYFAILRNENSRTYESMIALSIPEVIKIIHDLKIGKIAEVFTDDSDMCINEDYVSVCDRIDNEICIGDTDFDKIVNYLEGVV